MGTRTSHAPGTFSWVDLSTSDQEGAKGFYGELFGWDYDDRPIGPDAAYSMAKVSGSEVAAISPPSPGDEGPPRWNSYVTVANADATAAKAAELGGAVAAPAFDVFESGRMAVLQDSVGAFLAVWQPMESIGAQRVNEPGCLSWNELGTSEPDKATAFYTELFGWRAEPMDTGGGPSYAVVYVGERSNGGIREQSPDEQQAGIPSNWLPYFVATDSADESVDRAKELGAGVLLEPTDMPNGGRIAALSDPQGAAFALWDGPLED